jgi:hypothetical protein
MLTSKDLLFLASLVTLIVVVVRRQSGKANRGSLPQHHPLRSLHLELRAIATEIGFPEASSYSYHTRRDLRTKHGLYMVSPTYRCAHRLDTRRFCLSTGDTRS